MKIERIDTAGIRGKVNGIGSGNVRSGSIGVNPVGGFGEILRKRMGSTREISFSAHAAERLHSRNISFSPADRMKLGEAFDMAETKGARQSLVVFKDQLLIVSIPNRTVITAMDGKGAVPKIFTNIDSAVVVKK